MLQRNLAETGLASGQRLVVLVGMDKDLAMAVKDHRGRKRYTRLRRQLMGRNLVACTRREQAYPHAKIGRAHV